MRIDLTIPSYVILSIVLYYGLLFTLSRRRPAPTPDPDDWHLFVVIVPARNEESVLDMTLANLTGLDEPDRCRVLVVDDGSTDATPAVADSWAVREPRVRVLHRVPPDAGTGKSEVLNTAYRAISAWCASGDLWLDGRSSRDVVIAIVDADGRLEVGCLATVVPYFADPAVGTVQIGVRIANAATSTLARMQDMEFVGFSWLVQIARDRLGSSGLGGNGQFSRLDALRSLGSQPWAPGALTEDLDLGLRLVVNGWRTRFCADTSVAQQGLERWGPLLRQRTRWIQGHYQCWRHVGALLRARRARLATRLDLVLYLLLVVTVLLVSATVVISVLAYTGQVQVINAFLTSVPEGVARQAASLGLSILPVSIFMYTYQRHSGRPFRWFEVPAFAVVFTLYTYVWLYTSLRALARLALHRNTWVKTPRVAVTETLMA